MKVDRQTDRQKQIWKMTVMDTWTHKKPRH